MKTAFDAEQLRQVLTQSVLTISVHPTCKKNRKNNCMQRLSSNYIRVRYLQFKLTLMNKIKKTTIRNTWKQNYCMVLQSS